MTQNLECDWFSVRKKFKTNFIQKKRNIPTLINYFGKKRRIPQSTMSHRQKNQLTIHRDNHAFSERRQRPGPSTAPRRRHHTLRVRLVLLPRLLLHHLLPILPLGRPLHRDFPTTQPLLPHRRLVRVQLIVDPEIRRHHLHLLLKQQIRRGRMQGLDGIAGRRGHPEKGAGVCRFRHRHHVPVVPGARARRVPMQGERGTDRRFTVLQGAVAEHGDALLLLEPLEQWPNHLAAVLEPGKLPMPVLIARRDGMPDFSVAVERAPFSGEKKEKKRIKTKRATKKGAERR